jgi:actin-like ATPase involved in cell morphogenesis
MLQRNDYFYKSIPALKKRMFTPALRMVVCIPSGITEVEMRAVKESVVNGKEVYLIHEPWLQLLVLVSILCNLKET